MTNPTTNYGWVMPTATDLVTDLPADFNVFGQAVDTSMAGLLGGTTGQILSKTSATNMAFTWITNDQGDLTGVTAGTGISVTSPTGPVPTVAIDTTVTVDKTTAQTLTNKTLTSPALTTPTISTATTNGDLLYGTGSGALSRLGIGSSAQVLTVAGGVPTWATPAAITTIVKQITFGTLKSTASTSSTSFTDTGLSASITPTSASSKIMVTANVSLAPMASGGIFLTLTDGSNTILLDPTSSGNRSKVFSRIEGDTAGQYAMLAQTLQFVDSPGSTSAKTYKIRWFVSGGTGYINRMTTDADSDSYAAGISTITLTEYAV